MASCTGLPKTKDVAKKIKDPAFRDYCVVNCDANSDGVLSMEEAAAVEKIAVPHRAIKSFKGIEYFTGLKCLECSKSTLESIELALPSLEVLQCERIEGLEKIDVSKCPKLQFIYASHTGLKKINLSKQKTLYRVWVDNTPISKLDLSNSPKLNNLNVENCPNLKEVKVSPSVNRTLLFVIKDAQTTIK